jgi:hypothetical protein
MFEMSPTKTTNTLIEVPYMRRLVGVKVTFGSAVPQTVTQPTMKCMFRLFVRETCIPHHAQVVVRCYSGRWRMLSVSRSRLVWDEYFCYL